MFFFVVPWQPKRSIAGSLLSFAPAWVCPRHALTHLSNTHSTFLSPTHNADAGMAVRGFFLRSSLTCPAAASPDTTYSVAGARDHYREQNRNAGVVLERLPEYSNMFSKLPHHPSTTYR